MQQLRRLQEQDAFIDNLCRLSKSIFDGRIKSFTHKKLDKKKERVLNLILSDLHIGSDISRLETGFQTFGIIEESRRLAKVVDQVNNYKIDHRDTTALNVYLLGDIIQGNLHDMRDGAALAEQYTRAVHLLTQVFAAFAANFRSVNVYCQTGNHGRNKARHHSRAIHQKWDSIETMLYTALRHSFCRVANIKFHIPKTPFSTTRVFHYNFFATHGDTTFTPGNPGKNISVGTLENQANRLNARLVDREEYKIFMCGHAHTATNITLLNGAEAVINGALVPVDQYGVSLTILENSCSQTMWESTADYPFGDHRKIGVGHVDDANQKWDKIIRPWDGVL